MTVIHFCSVLRGKYLNKSKKFSDLVLDIIGRKEEWLEMAENT